MTTTIDFTYTMTSEEETLEKLQRDCRVWMETIEALEEMRGTGRATEEEINEAIEEANRELEAVENTIIEMTWKV